MSPRKLLAAWRLRWLRAKAPRRRLAICTIATRAFLPWAHVLFQALRRHHPQAQLVLLYVREPDEPRRVPRLEGIHVVGIDAIVDRHAEENLRRRYGLAELCFALKPAILRHCLDRFGERALYFDSDIDIRGPLDTLLIALEAAPGVLTPHLDTPLPMDGKLPSEMTILRSGVYNGGFVGVGESAEVRRFLDWWQERVARWGFLAPDMGYQGDQKWLDFAPTLFRFAPLRDAGCNIGAWNLHSRTLARDAATGALTANGVPVTFVHFSGFDPRHPEVLSRYDNRHDMRAQPVLGALAQDFAQRVLQAEEALRELAWDAGRPDEPSAERATHRYDAMSDAAYRAHIECVHRGGTLAGGEEAIVQATVANVSQEPWAVARDEWGSRGIALSWHVRDSAGTMLAENNRRYFLPRDLGPGESTTMEIGVRVPPQPGLYRFEFDLVHESITWFGSKGSETFTLELAVDIFEPTPSKAC